MLALLLPTRNKPEELARILNEIRDSSKTIVYFYVAGDDPKLEEYKTLYETVKSDRIIGYIGGHQLGFSGAINFLISEAIQNNDIRLFMRCEDDFYFLDKSFDEKYLSHIPSDDIAMIWCNYVLKKRDAEPHTGAITRTWYTTLGYFSLPNIIHYFCDNVLQELAQGIDRAIYIEEPLIDHKHNALDPRKSDTIADERRQLWRNDVNIFQAWRDGEGYKQAIINLNAKKR